MKTGEVKKKKHRNTKPHSFLQHSEAGTVPPSCSSTARALLEQQEALAADQETFWWLCLILQAAPLFPWEIPQGRGLHWTIVFVPGQRSAEGAVIRMQGQSALGGIRIDCATGRPSFQGFLKNQGNTSGRKLSCRKCFYVPRTDKSPLPGPNGGAANISRSVCLHQRGKLGGNRARSAANLQNLAKANPARPPD